MSSAIEQAVQHARDLVQGRDLRARAPVQPGRRWAIGDLQCPLATALRVLERHDALGEDGWLRPDVSLLSLGDHFDFRPAAGQSAPQVGEQGEMILRWLAAHDPRQVTILAGNHDLCRVCEFAAFSDDQFARARQAAFELAPHSADASYLVRLADYCASYPGIASPDVVARDFSGFATSQRRLLQTLLASHRVVFAHVEYVGNRAVLATHTGVTNHEMQWLELENERSPAAIAAAINGFAFERVARSQDHWQHGYAHALDLEPLHYAGRAGCEGGGLFYARPADPGGDIDAASWQLPAYRRYPPNQLPDRLAQLCGHTGHSKALSELRAWTTQPARDMPLGQPRMLSVGDDGRARYDAFRTQAPSTAISETVLIMADASLCEARIEDVVLLALQP